MLSYIKVAIEKFQASQNLTNAILNATTAFGKDVRVVSVRIHFDGQVTETVTIKTDDGGGSNFDTVVKVESLTSASDFVFRPNNGIVLTKDDKLNIQVSKATATETAYLTVVAEEL